MSSLREHYQAMSIESLEELLNNAVLDGPTRNLVKTVINEKSGDSRYIVTRIKDETLDSTTVPSDNLQKNSRSSAPVSGFFFLLIGSVTLALFVHMTGAFINAGGGVLLPIGALILLWIGSKRLRSWPFVIGAVFIMIGLIFLVGYSNAMPATAQYPGLRIAHVGSSIQAINLGYSIPTIVAGTLLILYGAARFLLRSRKKQLHDTATDE